MPETKLHTLAQETIADFGDQWTRFTDNDGFYGSRELFEDICGPLLSADAVRGLRVAEIGSGSGRIVGMMLACGAAHVVALEPSDAFEVLRRNLAVFGERVECVHATGDRLPVDRAFDLVTSIGVLHHIPDPAPAVTAAFNAVRPGGRFLVWLYGREGNELYLLLTQPLRALTTRLPHAAVLALARFLATVLEPYIWLCGRLPLPLGGYFAHVFGRMHRDKKVLIIYDQLRPAYARYYRRAEAIALLSAAGFEDVQVYHRHGYSWTVVGTRPR
jgi:SAM-dependent methyltransferase